MDFQFLNHQSLERSSSMYECEDEKIPPLITGDTPDFVKDLGFTVNSYKEAYDSKQSNDSCELGLKADAEQSQKNQRWRNAYQTKSGRWRTEITHPVTKARIRFRSFDTPEEAKEAYDSKRREFDSMFPGHNKSEKSKDRCELGLKKHQRLRCVYPRKSGRWQTEIRHPITKARIHLGTFDTPEEAKEVYDSKRREFDLAFPCNKKLKQSNDSCKGKSDSTCVCVSDDPSTSASESSVIKASKARIHLGTFDTPEEAKEVYDSKRHEFDLAFLDNKKLKQANDDPSISSGESSVVKASNVNAESGTLFVTEERGEFDLDVIDSYGQLVGEYSRLDDELWLCRSEEDETLMHNM